MEHVVDERRRDPRVQVSEAVRYQFKDPTAFGGCLSADISESGIRIIVTEFIPLDSHILLQVQLPNGKYAEAEAKVMWATKYPHMDRFQIGLEFIEPHEAKQLIHQYIQWSN